MHLKQGYKDSAECLCCSFSFAFGEKDLNQNIVCKACEDIMTLQIQFSVQFSDTEAFYKDTSTVVHISLVPQVSAIQVSSK